MILYRVCKKDEIDSILINKSFDFIDRSNNYTNNKLNNHVYNDNYKYLHFFDNIDDIFYLNLDVGYYLCIYDIPDEIANKYKGYGYYLDIVKFSNIISVDEYAIESNEIEFDSLKLVYVFKNYVDFDDYVFDYNEFNNCIELYYDSGEKGYEKKLYKNE